MLFSYTYVHHDIEKMQGYVDFIFNEVWCNARTSEYGIELFDGNAELKEIVEHLWLQDEIEKPVKSAKYFVTGLNSVFIEFKKLSAENIAQLKSWYQSNNNVENCCSNAPESTPVIYAKLVDDFEAVKSSLELFFKNLYSHNFLNLEVVRKHIGTLADHYKQFVEVNDEDICPFCGLMPLDSQWSETRDAYDHYLPKSKYPFNSINMRNLPPACNTCNSKNKGSDDPINLENQCRKAFYPFSETHPNLDIKVSMKPQDWTSYSPDEISLSIEHDEYQEEINSWMDVYGIENRYKDYLCRKNFGKAWMVLVKNWMNRGLSTNEFFEDLNVYESYSPYSDYNFIKKPFLESCKKLGFFDEVENN